MSKLNFFLFLPSVEADELSLRIGDRVRVWWVAGARDWWQGEVDEVDGDSKIGLFPSTYCVPDDLR